MQMAFMVVTGSSDNYRVVRVFEVNEAAQQYALQYNNDVPWSNQDDKARVEDVEFVSVEDSARALREARR